MAKAARKSAFVTAISANKEALAEAAQAERSTIANNDEILAVLGLKEDESTIVHAKLISVKSEVHPDGTYKGLPFVRWTYQLMSNATKNLVVSNSQPAYNRNSKLIDGKSLSWIFMEFQAYGFETGDWGNQPHLIDESAEELDKEKPEVMLRISCSKIKSGNNVGKLAVNYRVSRVLEQDEAAPGSSQEDSESDLGDELDEAMEAPVTPPAAPEAPTVQSNATVSRSKAKKVKLEVGAKVKFNFVDEDGAESVLDGEIEALNPDGTFEVTDGQFGYTLSKEEFVL